MFVKKIITSFLFVLAGVILVFSPLVSAQVKDCNVEIPSIKWYSIANPGSFLPIVPAQCGSATGTVEPLALTSLPLVFLRLYGFLVSLSFYAIVWVLIAAGVWYIYSGFNDGNVSGPIKYLQGAATGLALILVFYVGLFTILGLLGFKSTGFDIRSFFN